MPNPWEADCQVDLETVRKILVEECGLVVTSLEVLGQGWDNDAYLVNGQLVFRIPRRKFAIPLLEREIQLLDFDLDLAGVEIPKPSFGSLKSSVCGLPFMVYPRIEGRALGSVVVDDETKLSLAGQLATALRVLHDGSWTPLLTDLAAEHRSQRYNISARSTVGVQRLKDDPTLASNPKLAAEVLAAASSLPVPEIWCRIHGDLYPLHILITNNYQISGIIDWGDMHHGSPAFDLAMFYSYFPEAAVEVLEREYGAVPVLIARLAAWRAILHATSLIPFARESGYANLERESKIGLDRAVVWLSRLS